MNVQLKTTAKKLFRYRRALLFASIQLMTVLSLGAAGVQAQSSADVYDYHSIYISENNNSFNIRKRTCGASGCGAEVMYRYSGNTGGYYRFQQVGNSTNYIAVADTCQPERGVLQTGIDGGRTITIGDPDEFRSRFNVTEAVCTPAEEGGGPTEAPGPGDGGSAPNTIVDEEYRVASDCSDRPLDRSNCKILDYIFIFTNALTALVGIVVVTMIAWGGFRYITSHDNPQWAKAGRDHVMWAVIALLIYLFFYAFLQWIVPGGYL